MLTKTRTRELPTKTSSEAPSIPGATPNGAGNPRGVPTPSRNERPSHHRLVLIGAAAIVAVATAIALIVVVNTDGSNAVTADVSQGPNADLAVDWTAADAARGPNADLPPDWFSQNAAAEARAASTDRGPNADLPVDATVNATTK